MSPYRRGIDTNVLIYAQLPDFREHRPVRRFLLNQLRRRDVTLAVTPAILHEFVHIVTDARRFDPPLAMTQALAVARLFLGRSNVACLDLNQAVLLEAFAYLERYQLGRKRVADTLFAATLLHHGFTEIIICNPGDFQVFEELIIIDPRRPPAESGKD